MQNINEFIGIIKGINFDGKINDKEVLRLQLWVDKNRNLAYDEHQIKLIELIDFVLEDHVIDSDVIDLILTTCKQFIKFSDDSSSLINELNGIVEGMICDGEVNEEEVLRLKNWMDTYRDEIKDNTLSVKLYDAINDFLEDGLNKSNKLEELFNKLNMCIKNKQFEKKLDYLCNQISEMKNIGNDLIEILNNEYAINEIHYRAENELMKAVSSTSGYCNNQQIIVVSLVIIAILEYDGNYYNHVRKIYRTLYNRYSEQRIEGRIRSILSKFKKQSEFSSGERIINVVLENAIVPQIFLPAFFEFIFDIYKVNFNYDLPEDLDEEFQFIYDGLRSNMLSDGDDISINVTHKTYKLIAATKHLISRQEELDAVVSLSKNIVKLIDCRLWGKEVNIDNSYIKVGYEGWEKTLKENTRNSYEGRKYNNELRSYWEPKFVIKDNLVYLSPPLHKVKSQYNYKDISIVVLNNDEELYRNDRCDIREIIGGYEVNVEKIEVTNPLGKLRYKLVVGDEIIYDSKEKLFRDYIVCNEEGHELNNYTDYEGIAHIAYVNGDTVIDDSCKYEKYCIGYKRVKLGDAIKIGYNNFYFSSMVNPGIYGQNYLNCSVQKENENETILVYHDDCCVVFESIINNKEFEIKINDKKSKLSDTKYTTTKKDSSIIYKVELDLQESGVYEIEVNSFVLGKRNRIFQGNLVYDNGLDYSKELIDEASYRVKVKSNLLPFVVDTVVTAKNFNPRFIGFDYNGSKYNYYIPFDFGYYKLSNGEWFSKFDYLWIYDINDKSVLTLYDSEVDGFLLYTESGTKAEEGVLIDKGYYKQLGIHFLSSYKHGNKFVTLVFTANGLAKYALPCYTKCVIDEKKTIIVSNDNPKSISITPIFHGKNKVFYELFNPISKKLLRSKLLESGQTSKVKNFKSFIEYTIKFHEDLENQLIKNSLLMEIRKTFYSKEDFVGRSFKIREAYINESVRGEFIEREYFMKNYYIKFTNAKDKEKGIFVGEIYSKSTKGIFFLKHINPVDIEICSDVIDEKVDINITNQGDGLLFDNKYKGIMNSMEHPEAPDIFLFTIYMNGEEI